MDWNKTFYDIFENVKKEEVNRTTKGIIGWTCSYIPIEIIEALGFIPIRIISHPEGEGGDTYLDPNMCPYIKSTIGNIMEGKYDNLSGIILTNSCDAMRRLFDALCFYSDSRFHFLLDVPRIIDSSSIMFFKDRLKDMISKIEKHFSIKISNKDLIESIKEANLTRRLIRTLFSLKEMGYPIRYSEILDITKYLWNSDRIVFNKSVLRLIENIKERERKKDVNNKRIMVTGSLLITIELIRLIEDLGGDIVYTDLCLGERISDEIPLDSDIMFSLSKTYLEKFPCARMLNTESRYKQLIKKIEEKNVKGLIYYALKFCDPYLYELPNIVDRLRSKDIRMLLIEGEYTPKVNEAMRTRVQAFLETLD